MQRRLRVGVVDLRTNSPRMSMFARLMFANLTGTMPHAVAAWAAEPGHEVHYLCYIGGDLSRQLPPDLDVLFISAFSQSAQLAAALANKLRTRGTITVLGGPHALCYPQDARRWFDYVCGYTTREMVHEILAERAPRRTGELGRHLCNGCHPREIPGVRERWPFIQGALARAPRFLQVVTMLGSVGCPFSCDFCIDAKVSHQPVPPEEIEADLRFLRTRFVRPVVAWMDPNWGVSFEPVMEAIERAGPPGSFYFLAESSLAILRRDRLARLARAGFMGVLPGIESFVDHGRKSRAVGQGRERVRHVAEHVNEVLRHIPYVQGNFVFGLDADEGHEPYELTRLFLDLSPAVFPGYSLLSAFGSAAPSNEQLQREGRILPYPFHLLNNNLAMNVRPAHYGWTEFYDEIIGLLEHSYHPRAIARRFAAQRHGHAIPQWMNVVRATSAEGWGRLRYHREVRRRLEHDREVRAFAEGETTRLPAFYRDRIRRDLGAWWDWLPPGALEHDPNTNQAV